MSGLVSVIKATIRVEGMKGQQTYMAWLLPYSLVLGGEPARHTVSSGYMYWNLAGRNDGRCMTPHLGSGAAHRAPGCRAPYMAQLRDLPCGPPGSALHPSHLAMMKPTCLPLTVLSGTHTGASVVAVSVTRQEGRYESCLMGLGPDLS